MKIIDSNCKDQPGVYLESKSKKRSAELLIYIKLYGGGSKLNDFTKIDLKSAASQVKIKRKSLDDYQNQLRTGYYFKFDFDQHKNDKVGILREYNKFFKKISEIFIKRKSNLENLTQAFKNLQKKDMRTILKKHKLENGKYCCYFQNLNDMLERMN